MMTEAKSFVVVGAAGYAASRYVFDAPNKRAIMFGLIAGAVMVAALQLKVKVPGLNTPVIDKTNSPDLPETDNSKANVAQESLVPVVFKTGAPLNNTVSSQLTEPAVSDWDMVWGDNPYKAQTKTISIAG